MFHVFAFDFFPTRRAVTVKYNKSMTFKPKYVFDSCRHTVYIRLTTFIRSLESVNLMFEMNNCICSSDIPGLLSSAILKKSQLMRGEYMHDYNVYVYEV